MVFPMRLRALFRGVVGVIATLITLVAAPVANARLNMVFTGVEGSNQIYWHFSGCVTVDTATTFGPLNDAAWLYPDGTVGWSFFFNTGTGDDLVKKSANTTLVSAQEYRWVIRDSSGSVLQIIPVQITSWWINLNGQAIEPRTQPYTVPNLEVGQQGFGIFHGGLRLFPGSAKQCRDRLQLRFSGSTGEWRHAATESPYHRQFGIV